MRVCSTFGDLNLLLDDKSWYSDKNLLITHTKILTASAWMVYDPQNFLSSLNQPGVSNGTWSVAGDCSTVTSVYVSSHSQTQRVMVKLWVSTSGKSRPDKTWKCDAVIKCLRHKSTFS